MQVDHQTFDGLYQSTTQHGCGPYEPSIASSASSSQASIFSDVDSTQSSIASSVSDEFRNYQEDARDRAFAQAQVQQKALAQAQFDKIGRQRSVIQLPPPSYADITSIPQQQRHHPRRCSLSRGQKPPTLQRQCERKTNFVENLVGKSSNSIRDTIHKLRNSV
jgi:PHO85 cyclin-5